MKTRMKLAEQLFFIILINLFIYTQYSSPRVDYIFSTLLDALGIKNFNITTDKTRYENSSENKINYSFERLTKNEVWIKPANLLFQTEIQVQAITCFDYNGSKAFFETSGADFPFDIFAASFYLIARYEEYLPHKKDFYGRYAHENSIAHKEGFLHLPLINLWLQEFSKLLLKKFPSITFHSSSFVFLPTYDIDIAFSYLNKGIVRNTGGLINSMWHSEWQLVKERIDTLFGKQPDPFDSYKWLDELHEIYKLKPVYFFLLAQSNKDYDKNIAPQKRAMKRLVQQHARRYEVGIHPSWQSGDKEELLKQEIAKLAKMCGRAVLKSRQHYIRMTLPETYRRLIEAGIAEDYSMGYGSINGFRASYCMPFLWYDLLKEETTNLTVCPFCFMDANSYYEQRYNSEEALHEMNHYYKITKQVNGWFVSIWHNHFLGTDKMFAGWREVYKEFCQNLDLRDFKD